MNSPYSCFTLAAAVTPKTRVAVDTCGLKQVRGNFARPLHTELLHKVNAIAGVAMYDRKKHSLSVRGTDARARVRVHTHMGP